MLTEPMTTPPTKALRIIYGTVVGLMFAPQFHIGSFYFTPELALVAGNIISYAVSPKIRYILKLKGIKKMSPDSLEFVFEKDRKLKFKPGRYFEWTFKHNKPDSRGIRRYFTIASSPTESDVRIGVKFYDNSSSFKKSLISMKAGDKIVASQMSGDFVLPKDKSEKLAFMAGGIGVTPFRSMTKYMIDKKERRDVVFFNSNKLISDLLYNDIFSAAEKELDMKMVYTLTELEKIPGNWLGGRGVINEQMIKNGAPDYMERTFYLSGPPGMVNVYKNLLKTMGVPKKKIKTDYFPGLA